MVTSNADAAISTTLAGAPGHSCRTGVRGHFGKAHTSVIGALDARDF